MYPNLSLDSCHNQGGSVSLVRASLDSRKTNQTQQVRGLIHSYLLPSGVKIWQI